MGKVVLDISMNGPSFRSSSAEAPTLTTDQGVAALRGQQVVTADNISWPTRGPNVNWTIGSTMRPRADWRVKKPCK
jgi:hypothetical protein